MDEKQLRKLLKEKEDAKLEFKSQMYQLEGQGKSWQWNELIKDLIALANGNIGTANKEGHLIIGAADQLGQDGIRETYDVGEVKPSIERLKRSLVDKLSSFCQQRFQDFNIEIISLDSKEILVITLPPSDCLYELKRELEVKTSGQKTKRFFQATASKSQKINPILSSFQLYHLKQKLHIYHQVLRQNH